MLKQTTKRISASAIAGIITFLSIVIYFLYASNITVSAVSAFPMKTYIVGTSNIRTYSDTSLSNAIGWIYPTDEVIITKIYKKNGRYVAYGSYPTSRGSKNAYFDLNSITTSSNSFINNLKASSKDSRGYFTTYRRPGSSAKAGSIDPGDMVFHAISVNGYTQVLYNIGSPSNPSGMRLAWMTTDNYNRCVGNTPSTPQYNSTNLSQALYKNSLARITCGFDGYTTTRGRHEGIDFSLSTGSPIYSLTDGVVTRVYNGYRGSNGLSTIAIYYAAQNKTVIYLHSQPCNVWAGKSVSKGEHIGYQDWRGVSSSGSSHTHVEVRNGRQSYVAKSVNDYNLENPNPNSLWNSLGYNIR